MKNRKILIVDNDDKNLRVFHTHFTEAKFAIDLAKTDHEALDMLFNERYDVVLSELAAPGIDGYRILEIAHRKYLDRAPHVIFLTQKSDVWHRVKSFKLGAKDYIVKPKHIREIVERVRMVLTRVEKRSIDPTIAHRKFIGRLEDLNLGDLILVFGLEHKSGVLTLYSESGTQGQVFFRQGSVIDANALSLRAEGAIYKMLTWQKGRFTMLFCDVDEPDQISVSNMGLLLQGVKRMETREELLKQLPSLDAVLVTTSNFQKIVASQHLEPDLEYFVSLFDGVRTFARVIDESNYDELTTLKRIDKLFNLGFLHVIEMKKAESEPIVDRSFKEKMDTFPKVSLPATEEKIPVDDDHDHEEDDLMSAAEAAELESAKTSEEQDPFSIFRNASDSQPFGSHEWVEADLPIDEELLKDTRRGLEESHPLDALLKIRPDQTDESEEPTARPPARASLPVPPVAANGSDERSRFKQARGSVLIFSASHHASKKFVEALVNGATFTESPNRADLTDIYYGTAEFKGGRLLNIISLHLDKEFTPFVDLFASRTAGYLILIDNNQLDWPYFRYLVSGLESKLSRPWMVVVQDSNSTPADLQALRQKLGIPDDILIDQLPEINTRAARKLLFSLFESFADRMKPTTPTAKGAHAN